MQRKEWVDASASLALQVLEFHEARQDKPGRGRHPLPASVYHCVIAPFLHFDAPLSNQLYAIGGRNEEQEALATVEMFDTWHGQWVACPEMMARRAGCAAAILPCGNLLVVGGYDEKGIVEGLLRSCEVFDPARQQWSPVACPLQRARWGHGCATIGGKVYAVGGCSLRHGAPPEEAFMDTLRSCEVYDPTGGAWLHCSCLNIPRAGARIVTLGGKYLAAVGGCDDVFGRAEILATIELFDSCADHWSVLASQLSTPRTTAAVAALDNREILIFGGAPSLSSCEVYGVPEQADADFPRRAAPRKLEGPPICDITEGRMGCQAVAIDLPAPGKSFPLCTRQCVVVVGGENGDEDFEGHSRHFNSVLVYDVEASTWRPQDSFPQIPTPRTALALCKGPGRIAGHL